MKTILSPDGREVDIQIPDFGMYRVDGETMGDHLQAMGEFEEREQEDIDADVRDAKPGIWETRRKGEVRKHMIGIVIGENPDARLPEYGTDDAHLAPYHRRIVRWSRPADSPRIGDVVLVNQFTAVDWTTFFKEPCDTTPACEFILTNEDRSRWIKVPRSADVTTADIQAVAFILFRSQDLAA